LIFLWATYRKSIFGAQLRYVNTKQEIAVYIKNPLVMCLT